MPKVKLWVSTDRVGSTMEREVEIYDDDWEDMSDYEKDELMFEIMLNKSMIEWGYEVF